MTKNGVVAMDRRQGVSNGALGSRSRIAAHVLRESMVRPTVEQPERIPWQAHHARAHGHLNTPRQSQAAALNSICSSFSARNAKLGAIVKSFMPGANHISSIRSTSALNDQ